MLAKTRVDVLVVAAHPPELRGLRGTLGDTLAGVVRGLYVTAKSVGLGMPVAGGATARRIGQLSPRAVVLLGTCGIYPGLPEYQPHDVVIANRVVLVDHGVLRGETRFPDPMQTELSVSPLLSAGLSAAGPRTRLVPVATTLSVTSDDTLAAGVVARTECHAESLEAFAVAHACHQEQIPFAAVLGVTHIVGSQSFNDWRQFEKQSAIAAAEVVLNWLHTGAQGLPHG